VTVKITVFWDMTPFNLVVCTSILEEILASSVMVLVYIDDHDGEFIEALVQFYQTMWHPIPGTSSSEQYIRLRVHDVMLLHVFINLSS